MVKVTPGTFGCETGALSGLSSQMPAMSMSKGSWLSRNLGEYRLDGGYVSVGEAADAARGAQVAGGNLGDAVEPGDGGLVEPGRSIVPQHR